jgi:hypothetical protein
MEQTTKEVAETFFVRAAPFRQQFHPAFSAHQAISRPVDGGQAGVIVINAAPYGRTVSPSSPRLSSSSSFVKSVVVAFPLRTYRSDSRASRHHYYTYQE